MKVKVLKVQDRYIFPAIFKIEKDLVYVRFPDVKNCFTDAQTQEEALISATEVLELCLYDLESEGKEIPLPSKIDNIWLDENEVIVLINVWMPIVRDKIKDIYIKKTLTIPRWLDELGKKEKLNFSKLLQEAIKNKLGININRG